MHFKKMMRFLNKNFYFRFLVSSLILSLSHVFVPVVSRATMLPNQLELNTHKSILDNGMTVLVTEMPESAMVSLYALIKTGSATEGKFLGSGITHFIEHLLFKGTHKRGTGEIASAVQSMGGVINASTGFDYTMYTLTVPRENFAAALEILADMLMHPRFDPEQIEKEREVIFNEMRMLKDNPSRYLFQLVFQTAYLNHPYRLPVIGFEQILRQITRDNILEYFQTFYVPNNMVLSIAGHVEAEEALEAIRENFKGFTAGPYVHRELAQEKDPVAPKYYEETYPTQLTRLSVSFPGVQLSHKDMITLDILASLLGQGQSSRLFNVLFREKKLVQSVSATSFTPWDRGIFEINCILDNENIQEVLQSIYGQIDLLVRRGIPGAELGKVKRRFAKDFVNGLQTTEDVAYDAAAHEALLGDFDFSRKYLRQLEAVTAEDIKRVARDYLRVDIAQVVVLKPARNDSAASLSKKQRDADGDIEKIVLNNGLTILLKESRRLPLIFINLAFNGGTRVEQDNNNGISHLTAQTWSKGTKKLPSLKFAEELESLGLELQGFSGRNSFGLKMEGLSDNLDRAIDLMSDLLENPRFDEQDILLEKERVKAQILARDDSVFQRGFKHLRENLFKEHPMRLDPLGSIETIEKFTRVDIKEFFFTYAVPQNMVLTVFGDFSSDNIRARLVKRFSAFKEGAVTLADFEEDAPAASAEVSVTADKEQAMVLLGFRASSLYSEDRYPLEILSALLGSAHDGMVFNKVREELGAAYHAGGDFIPGFNTGMIYFYALTDKGSVDKVKDILKNVIRSAAEDDMGEKRLIDAQNYLKGNFLMSLEPTGTLAFMATLDELYGLGHAHYQSYAQKIMAVRREDIQRVAKQYLDIEKSIMIVVIPE